MGEIISFCGMGSCAYDNSVFTAATYNLGPKTVTIRHRDYHNRAAGWCAITSGGTYDPALGGHLVLWALGLVIQFPPGSTVLIPSALLDHSNIEVQPGEERFSFTQYAAGALFHWVDLGCRSVRTCASEDPEFLARFNEQAGSRFSQYLGDFSTTAELKQRVRDAVIEVSKLPCS